MPTAIRSWQLQSSDAHCDQGQLRSGGAHCHRKLVRREAEDEDEEEEENERTPRYDKI